MRIDLHAHTTASDGTVSPADLVAQACDAELDVVAITDHDTTVGWGEAAEAARRCGTGLVRGMEMSTWYRGCSVHLLCYLHRPDDPALAAELVTIRDDRVGRVRAMVAKLAQDYPITWEDVVAQAAGAAGARTLGRPHIADALVAKGVVADRAEAFADLIRSGGRYYVNHYCTPTEQAITLVRAAGGVPVLAHPGAAARGAILPDEAFDALAAAGLAGLEVHHRDHDAAQVARLTALAARLDLLVTGSSDFHGAGKPNRLGEHLTEPDVLDAIASQGATGVLRPAS
ncbi:MAG: PHP domain-containing protein [Micrococcales bacterium]|nr:PHP domain-containing protein [Micrococcales bacterium]